MADLLETLYADHGTDIVAVEPPIEEGPLDLLALVWLLQWCFDGA